MKRKLIRLSPSTSVVSLPSQWIRKNKLQKGAEINVEEIENKIIISADSKKTSDEISIDVSDLVDRQFWHYIDAAYISGYNIITINTKDKKQTELLSKAARFFPGMIVYEARTGKVQLKDITSDAKEDQDKLLNRIFNMNITLLEDTFQAIKEQDWEVLLKIKKRDYHINSYISYCLRQINKFGYKKFSKTGLMSTYLKLIEMLSDKFAVLITEIGKRKLKNENLISELIEMYKTLERLHLSYSKEKLLFSEQSRKDLEKTIVKSNKNIKIYLAEIINLISDLQEVEIELNL
jgi:phosphate uptake regulator